MNVTTVEVISVTKRINNSNAPGRVANISADVTLDRNQPVNIQNGTLSRPDRPGATCSFWRSYGSTHVDFNGYDSFEAQIADHSLINDFITSVESAGASAGDA